MRRKLSSLMVLALLALPMLAQDAAKKDAEPSAQNKTQTKAELLKYMQQTRKDFEKSVKGLSEAQLNFKPGPDRWSVKQVSEHIALAESFLGDAAQKVLTTPVAEKPSEVNDSQFQAKITDRSKKAQAPPPLVPTGKWATEKEILKAFNEARDKNEAFIKKTDEKDLRSHVSESPVGALDAHEWELLVASHTARHIKQIEEVKADPNFPKS
jgi:hypothetical protein